MKVSSLFTVKRYLTNLITQNYAIVMSGMLLLVTFGPFLASWGFYFDDWPMIFLIKNKGDIFEFYSYDRPFAAWTDVILGWILGIKPLVWQIANLLTRWFVVVAFWWCLSLLWPESKRQVLYATLLFAIYPVFYQQPIAVTYLHVFIWYASYFLSIGLMIYAVRQARLLSLSTLLSILFASFHIFSVEYFWGLELIRPLFLWLSLNEHLPRFRKMKSLLGYWLPWLVLLSIAIIWRFAIFQTETANKPVVLYSLLSKPVQTVTELLENILQDLLYVLLGTWTHAIQPNTINTRSPILLIAWVAVIAISMAAFFALKQKEEGSDERSNDNKRYVWSSQALFLGSIALPVSLIPAWMAGRQIFVPAGMFTDRFGLPAMMGASLVIIGLIETLISSPKYRRLVVAILIGLAVGIQIRSANTFRRDWNFARDFYWQLYWRAPALQPNTALLNEGGIFQYTAKYALGASLNVLYPVNERVTDVPYWFFELDNLHEAYARSGLIEFESIILQDDIRNIRFKAPGQNVILISYERQKPHCLWVLNPADVHNPYLQDITDTYLHYSNLDRIIPKPVNSSYPDPNIFGPEIPHRWCYLYQKADLARQMQNWEEIIKLEQEAAQLNYAPSNSYEWFPFIEAHIRLGDLNRAIELSEFVFTEDNRFGPALCSLWERSSNQEILSSQKVIILFNTLNCHFD